MVPPPSQPAASSAGIAIISVREARKIQVRRLGIIILIWWTYHNTPPHPMPQARATGLVDSTEGSTMSEMDAGLKTRSTSKRPRRTKGSAMVLSYTPRKPAATIVEGPMVKPGVPSLEKLMLPASSIGQRETGPRQHPAKTPEV